MDAFSNYVAEVVKYPLLTKEQEIMLARQVQTWVTSEDPTPREIRNGTRAYQKLINCNLRLVISVAKKYMNRLKKTEFIDIVQEGNMGLAHGIKKFDPERGYALSTYVYWWIRQSISRYMNTHDRIIRLPSHAVEILVRMKMYVHDFRAEQGREPTIEECAKHCKTTPSKLRGYMERSFDCGSLDNYFTDDKDVSLIDNIADSSIDLMDSLELDINKENIDYLLENLEPLDKKLMEEVFGFNGHPGGKSFQAFSKENGMSRERARQRFNKALHRMRVLNNRKGI
jgi:RNA polymerase sigma factor (sigma-70 family)